MALLDWEFHQHIKCQFDTRVTVPSVGDVDLVDSCIWFNNRKSVLFNNATYELLAYAVMSIQSLYGDISNQQCAVVVVVR